MSTAKYNNRVRFGSVVRLPDVLLPQKVRLESLPPPSNAPVHREHVYSGQADQKESHPLVPSTVKSAPPSARLGIATRERLYPGLFFASAFSGEPAGQIG